MFEKKSSVEKFLKGDLLFFPSFFKHKSIFGLVRDSNTSTRLLQT